MGGEACAGNIDWKELLSSHTRLLYQSPGDMKKFGKKIAYYPEGRGVKWLFSGGDSNDIPGALKKKLDAVYERAQDILDMRRGAGRVTIKLYHDKAQLDAAYYAMYNRKCNIRAWYIFEYNTIYISLSDVHEGMLAHEMAHSIIDNYMTVRPPSATAEILARYVDTHLFE